MLLICKGLIKVTGEIYGNRIDRLIILHYSQAYNVSEMVNVRQKYET